MALKPPSWRKDAVASTRGWRHPVTGELLVARRISPEDVQAYNTPTPSATPSTPEKSSQEAPQKPRRATRKNAKALHDQVPQDKVQAKKKELENDISSSASEE